MSGFAIILMEIPMKRRYVFYSAAHLMEMFLLIN